MEVRLFYESDGKCFAKSVAGCRIVSGEPSKYCGTYLCKWYKPKDCKDWVRLDTDNMVQLYPPEEVSNGKD